MLFARKSAVRLGLLAFGIGVLSLSDVGVAADAKNSTIADADYGKLLDRQVKVIEEALKTPKDKAQVTKAKVAAVILAAIAQDDFSGADGQLRATVRDGALKVAALIDDKKFEDAGKKAAELATLKADPAAKKDKVKLSDKINVQEIMSQFSPPKPGLGFEKILFDLEKGKGKKGVDDTTPLIAYQVAIAAELTHQILPDKTPKKWEEFCDTMKASSFELAQAAAKKDAKPINVAVSKLLGSCGDCHGIYRKQ
jgi:hypothetical protein